MGTEAGTGVRGNRKQNWQQTGCWGTGEREREGKITGRLWAWVVGGQWCISENRQHRGECGLRGQMASSVLHTLRCGDAFCSTCNMNQLFTGKIHESGEWASQASSCIVPYLWTGSGPKSLPECWFQRQNLMVLYTEKFLEKNILFYNDLR